MKRIISTITALIMLITLSGCGNTQKANWSEHLEAGQKFLLDGNYEQAMIEFNKVIEIEPRNVDAYLGLADAYVAQGDYEKAIEVLEKGYAETESSVIQRRIDELKGIVAPQTEVTEQTEPPVTTVTEAAIEAPVTTVTKLTTEVTTSVEPELPTTTEATNQTEPPVTTVIETTTDVATSVESDPSDNDIIGTIESGVLVISGHGIMPDYNVYLTAPWYRKRQEINQVVIENGITSIGSYAFYKCSSITSITIPDGVTSIGEEAFRSCNNLTNITIPDSVTTIGEAAFMECNNLTSITIPDGVMSIESISFWNCYNLISITIPDSVTSIGHGAFDSCTSLTSITIPDSVTSIDDYAFFNCKSLTEVYYEGTEEQWQAMSVGEHNGKLTRATIHYNSTGTT